MNWDDLATFRAVAETLSFTAAARRLQLSVGTVSTRVRRLERTLGVVLLYRTTSWVLLSREGAILATAHDDIAHRYDAAVASMAAAARPPSRPAVGGRARHAPRPPW